MDKNLENQRETLAKLARKYGLQDPRVLKQSKILDGIIVNIQKDL